VHSFVERQEQLLLEFFELFADTFAHQPDMRGFAVIQLAVVKNELHVAQELGDIMVLVFAQLTLDSSEVHRFLHDGVVVGDVQGFDVHGFLEDVGGLVPAQSDQEARRGLFPLVVDGSLARHFGNLQVI